MSRKKILLVDDSRTSLFMEQMILKKGPYDIIIAGDGVEGVERAESERPDLILMDIQLPGMNGMDALRVLRAEPDTAGIPAIAVTASVMQHDRKLITEAGFDGYVGKPINLQEFLAAVNAMLARGKP